MQSFLSAYFFGRIACMQCTDSAADVARSVVCLSVCLAHGWAAQKWLNLSRCCLWAQETMY